MRCGSVVSDFLLCWCIDALLVRWCTPPVKNASTVTTTTYLRGPSIGSGLLGEYSKLMTRGFEVASMTEEPEKK